MTPQKVVPTMSVDGWVVGVKQRVDRLFAYWLANQKSQSYLTDSIISFQYDVQQHGENPDQLAIIAGKNLENYLAAHFDQVTVVVTVKYPNGDGVPPYHLEFDVKLAEKDIGYDIGRTLIEIKDGTFLRIIETQ